MYTLIKRVILGTIVPVFFIFFGTAADAAAPGDVISSFPSPGPFPSGLAYGRGLIWCADRSTDRIYKIDPVTGQVIHSFPSPGSLPEGLTWGNGSLWCSDSQTDRIYELDPRTGKVINEFPFTAGNPLGLAFSNGCLRVAEFFGREIFRMSPKNGDIFKNPLQFATVDSLGLAWDGSLLWNIDPELSAIYGIDPGSGEVDMIIPIGTNDGYGLAWDGNYLWYSDHGEDRIYQIRTDGDELFSQTNPLPFSITLYHTSSPDANSYSGTCTTNLAVPYENPHQIFTRDITYDQTGITFDYDQWGQNAALYTRVVNNNGSMVSYNVGVITYNLRYFLDPEICGTVDDIPSDVLAEYTVDGEMYDITDAAIQAAAEEAVGEEINLYWMYRNIHDYVIDHLFHNNDGEWNPAPYVLQDGSGSCTEYSYLFIAICRAAGLPARYQGGSHLRSQLPYWDSEWHRWQEMYIPAYGGWIPLDCNHDDRDYPGARYHNFGALKNKLFITLSGGGDSDYLDWHYVSHDEWDSANGNSSRAFSWDNNQPAVASDAVSAGGQGFIAAEYRLSDPEGDWSHIRAEYSLDGGFTWHPATMGFGGDGDEELSAPASGTYHTYIWNSIADIGYINVSHARLRFIPYIINDGTKAMTATFPVDNKSAWRFEPKETFKDEEGCEAGGPDDTLSIHDSVDQGHYQDIIKEIEKAGLDKIYNLPR